MKELQIDAKSLSLYISAMDIKILFLKNWYEIGKNLERLFLKNLIWNWEKSREKARKIMMIKYRWKNERFHARGLIN